MSAKPSTNYYLEPLKRIELLTSSLPRKCSTTELQRLDIKSLSQDVFKSITIGNKA